MKKWRFGKNEKIYIYGTGERGRQLLCTLGKKGYTVSAMIDIRYAVLKEEFEKEYGITVISPDDSRLFNSDNIIIISLWNGLAHEDIARRFIVNGINKIVFLPSGSLLTLEEKHYMRKAFQEIVIYNDFELDLIYVKNNKYNTKVISDTYEKGVSLLVDRDELYVSTTNILDRIESILGNREADAKGEVKFKASDYYEYKELFMHLKAGDADISNCKQYLENIGKRYGIEEQEKLLADRRLLYENYKRAIKEDPAFFVDSPIQCFLEEDKISILDGLHRFFFLIQESYDLIPILLDKEDFIKYDAKKGAC